MKIGKVITGAIVEVLLLIVMIFTSVGHNNYRDYGYYDPYLYNRGDALGGLYYIFCSIALLAVLAAIILGCIKSISRGFLKTSLVISIVAGVAAIAAGGIGLPNAIVDANHYEKLAIGRIPLSGSLILFAIIFAIMAIMAANQALNPTPVQKDLLAGMQGKLISELDPSKEVEKTAPMFASSNVGVGLWTNICFSLCQIFGMKSKAYEKKMARMQNDALNNLLNQVKGAGADALTDVHFALSNLTVIVSATAVFYKK